MSDNLVNTNSDVGADGVENKKPIVVGVIDESRPLKIDFNYDGNVYDRPEDRSVLVDVKDGKALDNDKIPKLEIIKAMAKKTGTEISDPKKDCRHCNGRGYEYLDAKTHAPIPCVCLYRNRKQGQKAKDGMAGQYYGQWNRDTRRRMAKNLKRERNKKGY
jgi:hypothetical protein